MRPNSFARHDWVWLVHDWRSHLFSTLAPDDYEAAHEWTCAQRPLVVGRCQPGDYAQSLRLGLALPQKRRIGVQINDAAVRAHRAPPKLTEALPAAPAFWRTILARLALELEGLGEEARVFGSLAWQYFACSPGIVYLTAESDIDLLFRPSSWRCLLELTSLLQSFQQRHPALRLDGEILLPDGDGVAWREVTNRPAKVLAKGMSGARLRDLAAVQDLFAEVAP